jgi:phage portal protein BeeE
MLLDEGMDITWPDIKLVDAQFMEQMKLSDAQIAGLYRVPLMLINRRQRRLPMPVLNNFCYSIRCFQLIALITNRP